MLKGLRKQYLCHTIKHNFREIDGTSLVPSISGAKLCNISPGDISYPYVAFVNRRLVELISSTIMISRTTCI